MYKEEEEVFIRGVNTNEDSHNAQHASHRPVQGGGGGLHSWSSLVTPITQLTQYTTRYIRLLYYS